MLPDQPVKQAQEFTSIVVNRSLPVSGEILVQPGQTVTADDVIGQVRALDDISVINVGQALGISSQDITPHLLVGEPDSLDAGQAIAEISGRLPFSKKVCAAPVSGRIAAVSGKWLALKADEVVLQSVNAFIPGHVLEVRPAEGVTIQTEGILLRPACGRGGEAYGPLRCSWAEETGDLLQYDRADERPILAIAGVVSRSILEAIDEGQVAGLIVGCFESSWLEADWLPTIPIVAIDGFGSTALSEVDFDLLKQNEGHLVSIRGTLPWEANVEAPLIIISDST